MLKRLLFLQKEAKKLVAFKKKFLYNNICNLAVAAIKKHNNPRADVVEWQTRQT